MKFYNIIVLMMIAAFGTACSSGDKGHAHEDDKHEHNGEIVMTATQMKKAGVATETVVSGSFTAVIKVAGQISRPQCDEYTISATMSGIVKLANGSMAEGVAVKSGQTIATVSAKNLTGGDPTEKAKAAYEVAERELNRLKPLVSDKIVTQREYEQAEVNYRNARAEYLALASTSHGGAVSMSAGIGGYVKTLAVKTGDYVNVGDPIATITQTRRLQLKVDVPECAYGQIKDVIGANFKSTGNNTVYQLSKLNGKLVSYSRTLPEGSAYFPVTFEFDWCGDIVAGSFVEVFLLQRNRDNVLTVPVKSLVEEQGVYYVYVREHHDGHGHDEKKTHDEHGEEGVFEKREVKLGATDGLRVEIVSGLAAGECVVTEGAYQVKLVAAASVIPEGHNHNN